MNGRAQKLLRSASREGGPLQAIHVPVGCHCCTIATLRKMKLGATRHVATVCGSGSGGNSGSAASSAFAVENSGAGECLPRTTPVTIRRTFTSASELVRALASLGFSQFRRGRYAAFRRVLVDSLGQVFRQS